MSQLDLDVCDGCSGRRGRVVVTLYFRAPGLVKLCRKCFGKRLIAGLLIPTVRKQVGIPVPVDIEDFRAVWRNLGWEVEHAMFAAKYAIWKESGEKQSWEAWS
jgi:hypothetical protein